MLLRRVAPFFALMYALFASASCGEDDSKDKDDCDRGSEGCRCKRDEPPCDDGLVCLSERCVDLGSTGGTGGGGSGGSSGQCSAAQVACNSVCTTLATDPNNCGDCGVRCGAGMACVNGACACPLGTDLCDSTCVDLHTNLSYCGSCTTACATGESCTAGECTCQNGLERCGELCVSTSADPNHCGACEMACGEEEVCSEAACAGECAEGLTNCDRSCVDIDVNVNHCGGCEAACAAGQDCFDGVCTCANGGSLCAGACTDTDTNESHCGSCDAECEAGQSCESGECTGSMGSGGTGGTGGTGGGGGEPGSGGTGTGGSGGTAGSAGSGGSGGSGGSEWPTGTPLVLILLDRSSSMFEPTLEPEVWAWTWANSALMDEADGAVTLYGDEVDFGFASYRGVVLTTPVGETNDACAEITSVSFAPENHAAINEQLQTLTEAGTNMMKWETPTGHALHRAMRLFEGVEGGRKFLLLLTDGNPNTCQVYDPQCGQDVAIKGVQDARAAGITTLVVGFGDIATVNTGCTPTVMHCGEEHLQDLANAGVGLGVAAQPDDYGQQLCPSREGGLTATYGTPGSADYYVATSRTELQAALATMLDRITSGEVP